VRALVALVVVAVTVVVQLTIVDRIAFPGGAGPNLVLLAVAALALAGGPMAGVLTGFLAGLALDVAPPGSHFTGQNALVFCLVGYFCGLLADDSGDAEQGHTALFEIMVTAAGAVCGEALLALLGVMLSDPRVTWPAITHMLPAAVVWDVLLCPFVLYAVAAVLRPVSRPGRERRPGLSPSQARPPAPVASQGAIRQLAGGSGPRLRLGERDRNAGSLGLRGSGAARPVTRPVTRREPQLKLGRPGSAAGLGGAAFAPAALAPGGSRIRFGRSSLGRSLLGGSVFSRSSATLGAGSALTRPSRLGRPGAFGRSAPLGRSSPFRHRGNLARPAGGGLAGRAPRFSRGSPLARLTGALRRSAGGSGIKRGKSPGRGWLRRTSPGPALGRGSSLSQGSSLSRRSSLGRGAFGTRSVFGTRSAFSIRGAFSTQGVFGRRRAGRSLTGTPRLRMPRPKAKRSWRTGGYR
jgi:rod shape-determining protein MreD